MAVLLIDFEAGGVDAKNVRILEIGAMLCTNDFEPTGAEISQLVWEPGYPPLTEEVKAVTGLNEDLLKEGGIPLTDAFMKLDSLIGPNVQYAIAFNRAYDETLFKAELGRAGRQETGIARLYSMPWLCAMVDIDTNYQYKSWRLAHLALEYGVTVNPKELHRAINDVELMRKMLKATGKTPAEMYAYQQVPWVYVAARTEKPWEDGGKSTDLAKARGYNWQAAKGDPSGKVFDKLWIKRIKETDFVKEQTEAQFQVRLIKEA